MTWAKSSGSARLIAWRRLSGQGRPSLDMPEWQSGITGIPRTHPAPDSKNIQGLLIEIGLHNTKNATLCARLFDISSSHLRPALIDPRSEETNTVTVPMNIL